MVAFYGQKLSDLYIFIFLLLPTLFGEKKESFVVCGYREIPCLVQIILSAFSKLAEVMFHDTQLLFGGVYASYQELMTLPGNVRAKTYLYHYGDNWDRPETWAGDSGKYTGDPAKDGFLGWTEQRTAYDFL